MPLEYTDTHICEKCIKEFEWNYYNQVRTKFSEPLYVCEAVPANKTLAYLFEITNDENINVGVNCPYCSFDNQFKITKQI